MIKFLFEHYLVQVTSNGDVIKINKIKFVFILFCFVYFFTFASVNKQINF